MIDRTWSLRSRLAVSLITVAIIAILGVTIAAIIGTQRGFIATESSERQRVAEQVATAAGDAFVDAGGWEGADLDPATALAEAAGARLILRPDTGTGGGNGGALGPGSATADVIVAGQQVGSVRLAFGQAAGTPGLNIAWTWIAVAATLAVIMAVAVAWWLSSRLTSPLTSLSAAVHAFGSGDRTARAPRGAPGEIGELSQAFDDMAEQIQRAEATRRALAHDVAHELRTPLAVLQAGLEELRDGLEVADTTRLASLHDQSLRIGRIVDDLGRLSEAEAPDLMMRPDRVSLESLARSALTDMHGSLDTAGLKAVCECSNPVEVYADADRVRQILVNLLTNAARYCRFGDSVRVVIDEDDDAGIIVVTDTGPGMSPVDAQRAFQRFHRGASATDVPGSGLGLAVVQALTQAQGGSATLTSVEGSGTTIVVRLPRWTGQGTPA